MDFNLYLTGQLIIVALAFALVSATRSALHFALGNLSVPDPKRQVFTDLVTVSLVLWLAILAVLAYQGFFFHFKSFPPRVVFTFLPPLVVIILLLFSGRFSLILKAIPAAWLVYIQGFRVIMELFLWMGFRGGYVPIQMTFEWLNYDIVVGITAFMAGYVFFRKGRPRRLEGIIWNVFGILLLFNIVLIAIFSAPGPMRVFNNEPANVFVTLVPFIWIPGFIVPFALAMHLFSLKQLLFQRVGLS